MKKVPKLRILMSLVMIAALVALTVVPVLAQPVTSPLSGSVTIDGVNAPVGTKVDVFVGTETTARATVTTTAVGYYEVVVFGAAADVGKALSFKVNNLATATSPASPTFANYQPQVVDLAATTVSYTLTVTISPSGSGTVTRNPDLAGYSAGTVVTLTANPGAGYTFSSWSGAVTGTANPTTVTMNSNKSVTATFTPAVVVGKYAVLLWWLTNR